MSGYGKTILAIFLKFSASLIGLVVTWLVTNLLSLPDSGAFFLVLAMSQVLGSSLTLGLGNYFVRQYSVSPHQGQASIHSDTSAVLLFMFTVSLLLSLFAFGVMYCLNVNMRTLNFDLVQPLIITSFATGVLHLLNSIFQGVQKALLGLSLTHLLPPVLFLTLAVLTSQILPVSFLLILNINVISMVAAVVVSIIVAVRRLDIEFNFPRRISPAIKHAAPALFVIFFAQQLMTWGGQIVVGYMLEIGDVAIVAVAQRLTGMMSIILVGCNMIYAPKFSQSFSEQNGRKLNFVALLSGRLMFVLAFLSLSVGIVIREPLLSFFNIKSDIAEVVFLLLLFSQFVNVVSGASGSLLTMTDNAQSLRKVILCSLIIWGPCILIPTYYFGILGMAMGTILLVSTQSILSACVVKQKLGFNPANIFRKVCQHEV